MRGWIGTHNMSTWMIVVSVVFMSATVHPSLLSYLFVGANAGLMILTREVARSEGRTHPPCWPCMVIGAVVLVIAMVVTLKVNWLAI